MRRFRFHLGTLVILVLVLGITFAALRESNEMWDSGVFTLTLGILLISVLLAVHRTEKRQAFWLGFALFGSAYLGVSLVPLLESRLITTKALAYIDSKVPRSIHAGLGNPDGSWELIFDNNSQTSALYLNRGNGVFQDVTAIAGSNPAGGQGADNSWFFLNNLAGLPLRGSVGATENFVRIGQSLLALIAAFVGGQLSCHLYGKDSVVPQGTTSNGSGG
jgi:hypothetical protein